MEFLRAGQQSRPESIWSRKDEYKSTKADGAFRDAVGRSAPVLPLAGVVSSRAEGSLSSEASVRTILPHSRVHQVLI